MTRNKRTKAVDIVGRWVEVDNKIIRYENISSDTKCSRCNGTDKDFVICHGATIKKKPKWFQLKKRLEYWLEDYES